MCNVYPNYSTDPGRQGPSKFRNYDKIEYKNSDFDLPSYDATKKPKIIFKFGC
jgi:hypothetical protein